MYRESCPFCYGFGQLYSTNKTNDRLSFATIGAPYFIERQICEECMDKVESQFNLGNSPTLKGRRFTALFYGLPKHLHPLFEQEPHLWETIKKVYQYINYIYSKCVAPEDVEEKKMMNFAGLLAYLEEEHLIEVKDVIIEYIQKENF